MNIGKKIKNIRKSKKITQKQLGEMVGKSEISIRKYESQGNIPLDVRLDIAKVLDIDVMDLLPEGDSDKIGSFKKYLESKNYFIDDDNFINELESKVLEYIDFKINQNKSR